MVRGTFRGQMQDLRMTILTYSFSLLVVSCMQRQSDLAKPQVAGGATTSAFPEVVRIDYEGGPCTGTVVAPRVVLTAAHCIVNSSSLRYPFNSWFRLFSVTIGDITFTPARVVPHPDFIHPDIPLEEDRTARRGKWMRAMPYDIGLLFFDEDLPARIARVAKIRKVSDTATTRIIGYGSSKWGQKDFEKRWADVQPEYIEQGATRYFLLKRRYIKSDESASGFIDSNNSESAAGTNGDSGGPLLTEGKVIAIASWASLDQFVLSSYYPAISNKAVFTFLQSHGVPVE